MSQIRDLTAHSSLVTPPSSQQAKRYDPTGTLAARIVTADQAYSRDGYDPSATLPAPSARVAVTVRPPRRPIAPARTVRNVLAGPPPAGGGSGGRLPPPACWPPGLP